MRKILMIAFLVLGIQSVSAVNELTISDFKIMPGEEVEVAVDLTNDLDIMTAQMDITLPEGLSFVQGYYDETLDVYNYHQLTDRQRGHTCSSNITSTGSLRIFATNMNMLGFRENSGAIVTFKVRAADDVALGYQHIVLSNVELNTPDYQIIEQEVVERTVKIYNNFDITVSETTGGTVSGAGSYEWDTEATLTATAAEGYSFEKWSDETTDNPYTFTVTEAKEISAVFTPNSYTITYMLDGEKFATDEVTFGSEITAPEVPAREGYTFSGWVDVPETMPARDLTVSGSYTVNTYNVIYVVDGEEYKRVEVAYGAEIPAEAAPEREGYTFSGWSEVPATMPAGNVTVTGSFTVNSYTITYMLDGEEFATDEVEFGSAVTAPEVPDREGYTFNGWADVPETMPARDLTISGSYTVNTYSVIYVVDGEEYKRVEVAYGSEIPAEAAPEREGYTFSGWSEVPATMPAEDVTVTGSFTVNTYTITYMVDGEVYATVDVEYGQAVEPLGEPVREGYVFSGWSGLPETMPAEDVVVTGSFVLDGISSITADTLVDVYSLQGVKLKDDIPAGKLKEELGRGLYIVNGYKVMIP